MRDYYYILGIESTATETEIKSAYRKLSQKFHPDKNNGESFFEERFKAVQEAYETLSNAARRRLYDEKLRQFNSSKVNSDDLKRFEEALKRKFEEEFRKREQDLRNDYTRKEQRLKEEAEQNRRAQEEVTQSEAASQDNGGSYVIVTCVSIVIAIIILGVFLNRQPSASNTPPPAVSDHPTTPAPDFVKLVDDWNKAHNTRDISLFFVLFDNSVLLYGTQSDKNTCIESKLSLLKKYRYFNQQINGGVQTELQENGDVKCLFTKHVTINEELDKEYAAYLIFRKVGYDWKIITEGDLTTDKNLAKKKQALTQGEVKGDFNGDGQTESVSVVPPKEDDTGMDCVGDCTTYLQFSDTNLPGIKIENSLGGMVSNVGDLNGDGRDELGFLPGWFTSCWRQYHVFTYKDDNWLNAVPSFSTHCNQWEQGIKPIETDINISGNVIIRYSEFTGDDIVVKNKSVPIE
ncbi:DnaJ domain-containing protein [Chitinophaga agrisoli]|uniref:DnaJ domain-containing protein n=1 Tax=Chitinophaga agrisoli TaxID=2607653 RepID=A0A5B2VKT9_9BACT|nr:DnaJ domain-containing protein [Chitinophaga agrisoli]KAA2238809.1 DnaJ domain-containing protein [Chitinophaga agrisoli]